VAPPFITKLSCSRNDSNTAFLIHWCVTHAPAAFSATRSRPSSSPAIVCATARFSAAPPLRGVISSRLSHACSMTACSSFMREFSFE